MAFIGRLALTVPDLLQILTLSKKTGKLRLSQLGNSGEIGFKNGKVIYASSDATRNTLGQILIDQKRVTEKALMVALEQQHLSTNTKRLGAILVEKDIITPEVLEEAIRYQMEQAISEFLSWETGFFRFEITEMVTEDDIMVDAHEFLVKAGINPEHLLIEGIPRLDQHRAAETQAPASSEVAPPSAPDRPPAAPLDEQRKTEKDAPTPPGITPSPTPDLPPGGWLEEAREAEKHTRSIPQDIPPSAPDLLPAGRPDARGQAEKPKQPKPEATPPSSPDPPPAAQRDARGEAEKPKQPKPEVAPPPAPDLPPAGQLDGRGEGERSTRPKPEGTPPPTPGPQAGGRGDARVEAQKPTRPKPEAPPPPSPDPRRAVRGDGQGEAEKSTQPTPDLPPDSRPDERRKAWRPTRPRPEGTPAPDMPAAGRPDGKGEVQRPTRPKPEVAPPPADLPAEETPKPWIPAGKEKQPVPAESPSSPATAQGEQDEIQFSTVVDEIMLNSPIAPWVPMMLSAADVVGRGVLLFEREGGITGYDQFGVEGGIEGGDAQIRNIKIPLNEPSMFAGVSNRRKVYRGKIEPGKWNEYFVGLIGGSKPQEAVIIPIIVAGKVVGIFYGDDAGTGAPLGDVKQLEAMILKTFSAIELSLVEKKSKRPA